MTGKKHPRVRSIRRDALPITFPINVILGLTVVLGAARLLNAAETESTGSRSDEALDAALEKIDHLEATVERLNSRLAGLEQIDGERWLNEERAEQIRSVVTDVLADADSRTSFQSDGALAGYAPGKGFYLRSADGKYSMRISGQLQVRYIVNDASERSTQYGFQLRRAKLAFQGHVFDESWTYNIQGAFNRGSSSLSTSNSTDFRLENAYIDKAFDNGFSVRLGQFKAPWLQEDLVSSRRQLAVERSLLSGYFQQNHDRGIQLEWESDRFRLRAWTGNGIPTPFSGLANNITSSNWNTNPAQYSFVGRAEARFGEASWKEFADFNNFRGRDAGVMLGVSGLYQRYNRSGGFGNANATTVSGVTGDVTVNFGGASLFAYAVWQNAEDATTPGGQALGTENPWGFLVQGGYFLSDDVEVFGRYEYGVLGTSGTEPVTGTPYTDNELNMVTVGVNWFISGNDVKFTTDLGFNLDSLGLPAYGGRGFGTNNGAGYRLDRAGEDLQWSLRAQMQLLF